MQNERGGFLQRQSHLATKSLESSTFSDEWKIGYVTAIFKKGNHHLQNS